MQHDKDRKPACSTAKAAVPDEIACEKCNCIMEIWSDELEVQCPGCGHDVFR